METAAPTAPAPSAAPEGDAREGVRKRRVRNFLLDTSLQLKLASHLVAVALALSIGLGWLLWQAYRETSRVIALGDPEVGESLAQALASEDRWRIVIVAVALAGVLVCLLGASVVVTHRIAGPAFAIGRTCRRVAEGSLATPRPLRARDLLTDLGDDVAAMVEALREREARERDVALRAVGALRDPGASTAARTAAAAALEQLAREKDGRLGAA
jgi:hypothetical protein